MLDTDEVGPRKMVASTRRTVSRDRPRIALAAPPSPPFTLPPRSFSMSGAGVSQNDKVPKYHKVTKITPKGW